MDLTSDHPFWSVQDGLIETYPPLEKDRRCDTVIVGGGISGALLAHRLMKEGVSVILLDHRDIACGSTSASTALLQYEIDTPLHKLSELVGPASAQRAYALGIEAIHQLRKLAGDECSFALRPSFQIARKKADLPALRKEFHARRQHKLPVSILDESDLRTLGLKGAGALRSPIAAEVNPYRLTHRLLSRASKRGLEVYDRTTVTSYTASKGGVTVHTDRSSVIRCKAIFFATGYESQHFLPEKLVHFKSTYAFVSEPMKNLDWWRDRALIWGTGNPYIYMRTTRDYRVMIGGEDDGVLAPQRRDRQLPQKTRELVRVFHSVFPHVAIEPAFAWAGPFGSTKDGLSYIGRHAAFPRAYFALGFGGNGITFSQIAAQILADQFLGRKNADESVFSFHR